MKRICSIYKSPRKREMYLYVLKSDALARVPEGLLAAFGTPQLAFDLVLHPERQLAREDIQSFQYRRYHEGYPWFGLASFVLMALALLLELTVWRRLP